MDQRFDGNGTTFASNFYSTQISYANLCLRVLASDPDPTQIDVSVIVIDNVLYVLTLSCNLLSVSKLTYNLWCFVHFDSSLCVIHDPTSN